MAPEEVSVNLDTMLVTFPNIDQLKSDQEECLRHFLADRDVMAPPLIQLFKVHTTQFLVSFIELAHYIPP